MELFIRIVDGQPFEHPIMGDNFRDAFSHVDTTDLPPDFARFERVDLPVVGPYEIYQGVTYEWAGGIVKDAHHVRAMTDAEKAERIATVLAEPHPDDWVFDEKECAWVPVPLNTNASGAEPNVIG